MDIHYKSSGPVANLEVFMLNLEIFFSADSGNKGFLVVSDRITIFFDPFAVKDEYTRLWYSVTNCQDEYIRFTSNIL